MTDTNNIFINELIECSESDIYDDALDEWEFISKTVLLHEHNKCICGKKIKILYNIVNSKNDNNLIVGSVCIKKFMKNNHRLYTEFKMINYNKKAEQERLYRRRCKTCFKLYEIFELEQHLWRHNCIQCYYNQKTVQVRCFDCGSKFTSIQRYFESPESQLCDECCNNINDIKNKD